MAETTYSIAEAAEFLNTRTDIVQRLIIQGKLRCLKFGVATRVPSSAIRDFIRTYGDVEEEDTIILTQHEILAQWIQNQGIRGRVLKRANRADVRDKKVYGIVPIHLAGVAKQVFVPEWDDGQVATVATFTDPYDFDEICASLVEYEVKRK